MRSDRHRVARLVEVAWRAAGLSVVLALLRLQDVSPSRDGLTSAGAAEALAARSSQVPKAQRPVGDLRPSGSVRSPATGQTLWLERHLWPDRGMVTCPVSGWWPVALGGQVRTSDGSMYAAELAGDHLSAVVPGGAGRGELYIHDVLDGKLEWSDVTPGGDGICRELAVATWRTGVRGRVLGDPVEGAQVDGCGGYAEIDDGAFFISVKAPAECEIRVLAFVGDGVMEGDPVRVSTIVGSDAEADLKYPTLADYRPLTAEEKFLRAQIRAVLDYAKERNGE
jgi:hypothetical protein